MRDMHRMREKIELQLDNRQVVSFVIGSLVVLGVVFALGVLVGKQLASDALAQTAPTDPLAAIDAREELVAAVREAPPAKDDGLVEPELTFAHELTRPDPIEPELELGVAEPVAEAPKPVEKKPVPPPAPPPVPPAAPKESGSTVAAAFEKVAARPAPTAGFALQVSSFPERSAAEKFAAGLEAKGYEPFVVEADVPGKGRYYRVKIGSFQTRSEADAYLQSFRAQTSMQAFVTNAN